MAEILAVAGPAITALTGVYGAVDESGQNGQTRADAERSGQRSRQQINRLQQGPAAMPGYTQSVQGYGMPDASGQYTPIQPQFTDGPPEGMAQGNAQLPQQAQMIGQSNHQMQQDPLQEAATAGYMQGLYEGQMAVQPQTFGGVPVWFDDGPQNG
jgi:hypothetical protein